MCCLPQHGFKWGCVMGVYMSVWLCVCHRGCGSHRLAQSHIDPSSLTGWCKCLSTILSPLLLTRKITVAATSSCLPLLCVLLSYWATLISFLSRPTSIPPSVLPFSPFFLVLVLSLLPSFCSLPLFFLLHFMSLFPCLLHLLLSVLQAIFKLSWSQEPVNTASSLQVCILWGGAADRKKLTALSLVQTSQYY